MAQTTAGTAGGWYNVQDFLSANQGKPKISQSMEAQGQSQLDAASKQADTDISMVQDAPEASQFNQKDFGGMFDESGAVNQEALNKKLNQGFGDADQFNSQNQIADRQSPFSNLKGDTKSAMSWWERPDDQSGSQYTQGMKKMDELLLRGDKGFTENLGKGLQDKYQNEVQSKIDTERARIDQRNAILAAGDDQELSYKSANNSWKEGVSNFLKGEMAKINSRKAAQKLEYDTGKTKENSTLEYINPEAYQQIQEYNKNPLNSLGMNGDLYGGPNFKPQYIGDTTPFGEQMLLDQQKTGQSIYGTTFDTNKAFTPEGEFDWEAAGLNQVSDPNSYLQNTPGYYSQGTAALSELGDQGLSNYNYLANLFADDPYTQIGGEEYQLGGTTFNEDLYNQERLINQDQARSWFMDNLADPGIKWNLNVGGF